MRRRRQAGRDRVVDQREVEVVPGEAAGHVHQHQRRIGADLGQHALPQRPRLGPHARLPQWQVGLAVAVDANVLICERIREELRNGITPQAAIRAGYEKAWATILDANVTHLIAAFGLMTFGSGPIRGFAITLTIGILTSMFSAILVSRGLVNLIYGKKRKLEKLAIGQVWKPGV